MNTWLTPLDERALLAEHRARLATVMHEAAMHGSAMDAASGSRSRDRQGLRARLGLRRFGRHPGAAGAPTYASSC